MNNPENKNHMDFLDEIIALGFDTEKKSEFLQMLSDYLLKHTQDGRLYKYRAFDSNGYALNVHILIIGRIRSTLLLKTKMHYVLHK